MSALEAAVKQLRTDFDRRQELQRISVLEKRVDALEKQLSR